MAVVAIFVGVFYAFAGLVVIRAMTLDRLMDQVLVAIKKPGRSFSPSFQSRLLQIGAYLTLASGLSLMMLSPFTAVLFLSNAAWQGGYLAWAAYAVPPEDDADAKGRRQTVNAFVLFLAATAFVVWLAAQGFLRPWDAPLWRHTIDGAMLLAGCVGGWALIHRPWARRRAANLSSADAIPDDEAIIAPEPQRRPERLRLAPEWGAWPLWDDDTGEPVSPFSLGLPGELAARIDAWDSTFQTTYNPDDPASGGFMDDAERAAFLEEGRAIAAALKEAWPGTVIVAEPFA